jgi:hypothetical protein
MVPPKATCDAAALDFLISVPLGGRHKPNMNYLTHGLRFTSEPYFLAGTAVPDWLSVADRQVRMRAKRVEPFADGSGSIQAQVAAGVLQHLHDDHWFHGTRAFLEITGELARLFRQALGPDDGFRPGFLGHIAAELLLDGVLADQDPSRVDAYYAALAAIDAGAVQAAVNRMSRSPTDRLEPLLPLFEREQFLRDYSDPARLLYRLNQVLRRIKLNQLPDETQDILRQGRIIVEARVDDLLPADLYWNHQGLLR